MVILYILPSPVNFVKYYLKINTALLWIVNRINGCYRGFCIFKSVNIVNNEKGYRLVALLNIGKI